MMTHCYAGKATAVRLQQAESEGGRGRFGVIFHACANTGVLIMLVQCIVFHGNKAVKFEPEMEMTERQENMKKWREKRREGVSEKENESTLGVESMRERKRV